MGLAPRRERSAQYAPFGPMLRPHGHFAGETGLGRCSQAADRRGHEYPLSEA